MGTFTRTLHNRRHRFNVLYVDVQGEMLLHRTWYCKSDRTVSHQLDREPRPPTHWAQLPIVMANTAGLSSACLCVPSLGPHRCRPAKPNAGPPLSLPARNLPILLVLHPLSLNHVPRLHLTIRSCGWQAALERIALVAGPGVPKHVKSHSVRPSQFSRASILRLELHRANHRPNPAAQTLCRRIFKVRVRFSQGRWVLDSKSCQLLLEPCWGLRLSPGLKSS